jgi:hypothetical protein
MQLWQIILRILWPLRPALAVETNLVDIIRIGLDLFHDEDSWLDMEESPAFCAGIAASLLSAHAKLDLLICLRAHEIAGLQWRGRPFRACRHPHLSDRTPEACWRRFQHLVLRFEQVERLAHSRARKLKRWQDDYPLRLRPAGASSPMIEPSHRRLAAPAQRGRRTAASSRRDGGGIPLNARGPPFIPLFRNPANPPQKPASENASTRP